MAAELGAMLLHRRRRDDEPGRVREIGQERCVGLLERERHSGGVGRLHLVDGGEEERQRERTGIVERVVLIEHPLEVEDHRLGIELGAVMERHAVAQVEGVGLAVVGDLVALRERRLHLQRAVLEPHQPVIKVHEDAEIVDRRDRVRIERLGLGDLADDQDAGRCLCGRRLGQGAPGERGQRERDGGKGPFHVRSALHDGPIQARLARGAQPKAAWAAG